MGDITDRRWSQRELETLLKAKRQAVPHLSWKAVAALLPGRSAYQCEKKWQKRCFWLDLEDRIIAAQGAFGMASQHAEMLPSRVPQRVLAERTRRRQLAAAPRSVTAEFLNDPLPGCSALDKMMAGEIEAAGKVSICTGAPLKRDTRPVRKPSLYWGKLSPDQVREVPA